MLLPRTLYHRILTFSCIYSPVSSYALTPYPFLIVCILVLSYFYILMSFYSRHLTSRDLAEQCYLNHSSSSLSILFLWPVPAIFERAAHFWDFEQTPLSEIRDLRTSRKIQPSGNLFKTSSPSNSGIKVKSNHWVDLNLNVSENSCLFDPSNCTNGLTVAVLLKIRPYKNDKYQYLLGNNLKNRTFSQGITIYFSSHERRLHVAIHGSKHYCLINGYFPSVSWIQLFVTWTNDGVIRAFVDDYAMSHEYTVCNTTQVALPKASNYTLKYNSKATVYYDNLAIWYETLSYGEKDEIWNALTGRRNELNWTTPKSKLTY